MTSTLIRRQFATQTTLTQFGDKVLDWENVDCLKMAMGHASNLGHPLICKIPNYRTATGALKALKKAGYSSMEDLMKSNFNEIPAAFAILGDLVLMEGSHNLDSICLYSDRRKVFGWDETLDGMKVIVPHKIKGVYRVRST